MYKNRLNQALGIWPPLPGLYDIDIDDLTIRHEELYTPRTTEKLTESIRMNGLIKPIVVTVFNGELVLIDGYHRITVFKNLGMKKIKVKVV